MRKLVFLVIAFLLTLNIGSFSQDLKNSPNDKNKKEKRIDKRSDRRELKKLQGTKVSEISMKNFKIDFANATNVKWVRTPNYDIATFNLKMKEIRAYYDFEGKLVGTTEYKTKDDLPDRGMTNLQKKYKDYTIGRIIYFNNNHVSSSPMVLWGTEIEDRSSFFVELANGIKKLVVNIDHGGNVKLFKQL